MGDVLLLHEMASWCVSNISRTLTTPPHCFRPFVMYIKTHAVLTFGFKNIKTALVAGNYHFPKGKLISPEPARSALVLVHMTLGDAISVPLTDRTVVWRTPTGYLRLERSPPSSGTPPCGRGHGGCDCLCHGRRAHWLGPVRYALMGGT